MKKIIFTTVLLGLLPIFTYAADFAVEVDTGTGTINALEATLHIPKGLNIEKIYDGSSAILFWIKSPIYDPKSNQISFSGITPGGFRGKKIIFSFSGGLTKTDLPYLYFSEIHALANDGLGTVVPVRLQLVEAKIEEDNTSPERFDLTISSSPEIFNGARFLSFATQDKGTGIKNYEYASTWLLPPRDSSWRGAESPVVFSQKMLFQKIYIRAIDNSGNFQVASIAGPYHYAGLALGTIILLCIIMFLRRLVFRRYSSPSLHP